MSKLKSSVRGLTESPCTKVKVVWWRVTKVRGFFCYRVSGKRLLAVFAGSIWIAFSLVGNLAAQQGGGYNYDSREKRDPFIPLVSDGRLVGVPKSTQVGIARPVLYGILWDPGGESIALINDLEIGVGGTVGGFSIKEIRRDSVLLARENGEQIVLEIVFEALDGSVSSSP